MSHARTTPVARTPRKPPIAGAGRRPSRPGRQSRASQGPAPVRRPAGRRGRRSGAQAIIEAALDEFIARGFTATRLDDVAKRAGVAKGTIYLHFKDKELMFEELIRTAIVPLIGRSDAAAVAMDGSVRDALEGFARTFIQEVATTRRGDIVRLIVAEGPRFPAIADFYYREVVSRGLGRHARADRTWRSRAAKSSSRSWRAFRRSSWRPRSSP